MSTVPALEKFVSFVKAGMFLLPPDPNNIAGFVPLINEVRRDALGLVGQLDRDAPIDATHLDGGDSAHKTGVLAFCNSRTDQVLLGLFESNGVMVRHPEQVPWNNPKNCSRDQLTGFTAGCWRAGRQDIAARLLSAHALRIPPFTCQNIQDDAEGKDKVPPIGDPMGPHDVMALRICSGDQIAHLDLIGQFVLHAAIELADRDITVEKNQLILEAIICGRLNLYIQVHPNFRENIRDYWSGWRRQGQIGEAFIAVIERELERYANQLPVPLLLPTNVLSAAMKLNWNEVLTLDPAKHLALAEQFADAFLLDAQQHAKTVYQAVVAELKRAEDIKKIVEKQLIEAEAKIREELIKAAEGVVQAGMEALNPAAVFGLVGTVLSALTGVRNRDDTLDWRNTVSRQLDLIIRNTDKILVELQNLRIEVRQEFREHFVDVVIATISSINAILAGITPKERPLLKEERGRLITHVDNLRVLLLSSGGYGPELLPLASVAYAALLSLMVFLSLPAAEIATTRLSVQQQVFARLIDGPKGLVALADECKAKAVAFGNQVQAGMGTRSVGLRVLPFGVGLVWVTTFSGNPNNPDSISATGLSVAGFPDVQWPNRLPFPTLQAVPALNDVDAASVRAQWIGQFKAWSMKMIDELTVQDGISIMASEARKTLL